MAMDLKSFTSAIQQIADEKGISKERIFETIELALAAAYKRDYGKRGQIVRAKLDPETGAAIMKQIKIVVDQSMIKSDEEVEVEEAERERAESAAPARVEPRRGGERRRFEEEDAEVPTEEKKVRFNPEKHIMLEEARAINPEVAAGEEISFALEYHEDFGRIAAQTAKQVIIQRIREAEREAIYSEFKDKEGELVSGMVQRVEGRSVYIDIGRAVGLLPPEEQLPQERYRIGERVKAVIVAVERSPKGSGVILSRAHPRLLKQLFELEVPEIASGAVEVKAIAREAGARSKIAVTSHEGGVDPVGSLVGQKGVRVSTVIHELSGEKIDVIEWSEDAAEFIANSISPARALRAELHEDRHEAEVIVPEDQLSLAIGKAGQNVRLAAKLTGWKIDVRPERKPAPIVAPKDEEEPVPEITTPPEEAPKDNKTVSSEQPTL